MLVRGCPNVVQNRDEYNDNGKDAESELESDCGSMFPPLASCSGSKQIAGVHMKEGKAATSEQIILSDPHHRTKAASMIESSSSIILGCENGRVHTELDVGERASFKEQESEFLEERIGARGLHQSTKALRDLAEFHSELAELNIHYDHYDGFPRVSELVGKSSSSRFRQKKPEGDEAESDLTDQGYVRNARLNRSPIFGCWRIAQDRKDGENLESKLSKGQDNHEISVPVSSAVVHSRGKQLLRERDEVSLNPIDSKWRMQQAVQAGGNSESKLPKGQDKYEIPEAVSSAVVHSRGKRLQTERDEVSLNPVDAKGISLPKELVEKIFAMMSFPKILKTRALNKYWNKNFSLSPSASVFYNEVKAVSAKWKHYCPIILNAEKECLVGYDREYNRWLNMPLRFDKEISNNWCLTHSLRGAGSLMCGVLNNIVFVTNIVTRTWRWLPSHPDMARPYVIHLLPIGSEAYQVFLITKDLSEPSKVFCQLYDSRMEFWTIRLSTISITLCSSSSVYLNGVLYVMEYNADDFHDVMKLVSYDVSDGTWTNIPHPFGSLLHEIETYELLVCQNHVMVVLHLHPTWWTSNLSHTTLRNTLLVYRVDPDSLDIREVARGPPEPMSATCSLFASDKTCIYFGDPQVASSSVVELNLQNREWSCLPAPCADRSLKNRWATFSFQPGMNPFASV